MAFSPGLPDDPYYDFLPIDGSAITVGMDILSVLTSEGVVFDIEAPTGGWWSYTLTTETPWGVPTFAIALFPDDPDSQPSEWWHRLAMWTRSAHLADGALLTVADGSRWVFDAATNKLICHQAGSIYARGRQLSRGQLTTDPDDLVVADDPDWDWLPVGDGATVALDDVVRFAWPQTGVVDDITETELTTGYVRTTVSAGGTDIGFYDTITDTTLSTLGMECFFYKRVLKPVIYSLSLAGDGSRWIYTKDSVYFCWKSGSTYSRGAIFPRGQIGLTDLPSTATSLPPLIREVLQTPDELTGSATLTTSASVITGDVLLIIYATDIATPTDPTSSAGTCTQVGTDAHDGDGIGMVRVYTCPVGSDGEHTVNVSANVTAAVLVLTNAAEVDGFAKTNYGTYVSTINLPSVSPTGDTDLLVGIYFNSDGETFNLSGSGLIERADPKVTTFNRLSVGTVELESSSPTAAAYPATVPGTARPATVAVVMSRP